MQVSRLYISANFDVHYWKISFGYKLIDNFKNESRILIRLLALNCHNF